MIWNLNPMNENKHYIYSNLFLKKLTLSNRYFFFDDHSQITDVITLLNSFGNQFLYFEQSTGRNPTISIYHFNYS